MVINIGNNGASYVYLPDSSTNNTDKAIQNSKYNFTDTICANGLKIAMNQILALVIYASA